MSNTTANMSALEWFFRKPSASNFPQDPSSPELRQLSKAAKQLSTALLGSTPDLGPHSLHFAEWVGRVDAAERVNKADINSLIQEVDDVIKLVRNVKPTNAPKNVTENLNATVIALAILAKSSQDVGFREEVVALAKRLVPVSSNTSASDVVGVIEVEQNQAV
jgi:hypothetical protein